MSERKGFEAIRCYRRFLDGDNRALEQLVREYSDALIRFAYCYVKDSATAEEIMEDAFAALIIKRRRFDAADNLRAYLYKTVRNKCLDHLRFHKKQVPLADVERVLAIDGNAETENSLLRKENRRAVYEALQNLPSQYREILYLTYFEDCTADEASRLLRRTKKQIYNLLHRAKTSLKELLIKEGISYENV
ncbi:MAG: sigma-70 family RNA polymerase sigma factor [Clostridia bacterium]|nr:sigma-70 family RNA polymerase sigma factor [Clostridia bacterium]